MLSGEKILVTGVAGQIAFPMAKLLAADNDRQGEVAGQIHAASSAAWIVGPLVGTAVYALDFRGPLVLTACASAFMLLWTACLSNPPPAPARCSSSCRRSAR